MGAFIIPPALRVVVDSARIQRQALSDPEVKLALLRITGQAMFASATKSVGGIFLAIDPYQEPSDYNLLIHSLNEGGLFPDKDGNGVVVGHKLADKLNLHIGKKLVYTTTDVNGEVVSEMARVSSIFATGVSEIDTCLVLLLIDRVRKVLAYGPDKATLLAVMLWNQRKAG